MNLGKVLKEARKKKGYTQVALAEKSGLKQSQIARLETNSSEPRVSTLIKISKALDFELVIEFKELEGI